MTLVLTNDWELYGEGSGDFYGLQRDRLRELLACVESNHARITVFAEVGQQFAHIEEGRDSLSLRAIARDWEDCVRDTISRQHDVQLHWHPTWRNARFKDGNWNLDLKYWALADLPDAEILSGLVRGREYLDALGKSVRESYRCSVFRAGAFCLQPMERTLPFIQKAGLIGDSSIVPGTWDYLYFDYRHEVARLTTYRHPRQAITELPIYSEKSWDSPVLRRLLSACGLSGVSSRLLFGEAADPVYEAWAAERDRKLIELSPVMDPLAERRHKARLAWGRWPSYLLRRSSHVLDYDFMPPGVFASLVERALSEAQRTGTPAILTALGHANNSHTMDNLDRTLKEVHRRVGQHVQFATTQEIVERQSFSLMPAGEESLKLRTPQI